VFDAPFEFDDGNIKFERLHVEPTWLNSYGASMRETFPQLAVSAGACSPYLPDEGSPITDVSVAPQRRLEPIYKS
jgi:hypothetical protein